VSGAGLSHAPEQMSRIERSESVDGARASVLVVDDDRAFLALLHEIVGATLHLEIAGEAHSGEHAVVAAKRMRPDVVLMDVRMPGLGGIAAGPLIKAECASTLVVLISSTHPDDLPLPRGGHGMDAFIWKCRLAPRLLDETWLSFRDRL
jgi:DNA-binding NarL/FixJ family response regulator